MLNRACPSFSAWVGGWCGLVEESVDFLKKRDFTLTHLTSYFFLLFYFLDYRTTPRINTIDGIVLQIKIEISSLLLTVRVESRS